MSNFREKIINYVKEILFAKTMFLFFIYKGRHCCLFCNTTNANMQPPKSKQDKNSKRTLTTLANKLKAFREAGNDVKFAKFHDNVIDDVMFNVELDQVNDITLVYSAMC